MFLKSLKQINQVLFNFIFCLWVKLNLLFCRFWLETALFKV